MPSGKCRMKKMLAAVTVLAVATAQADTIYVDVNCPGPGNGSEAEPYCSIQTAIDNAVDTDEVVVAPGTYFETIDFLGKAITLRSSDGPDVTTIDGTGHFHVVQCRNGEGPDNLASLDKIVESEMQAWIERPHRINMRMLSREGNRCACERPLSHGAVVRLGLERRLLCGDTSAPTHSAARRISTRARRCNRSCRRGRFFGSEPLETRLG